MGKALGVADRLIDEFAKDHYWFDDEILQQRLEEAMERAGVREDPLRIAQKELQQNKIPLTVRRYLPDGSFEDFNCSELLH